jgi:purine nucleosidase
VVFESGVRVVMVPLEVSHTALVTPHILDRIRAFNSDFGAVLIDLLLFFQKTYPQFQNKK